MYIYLIENKINGKNYIGQTSRKNPKCRWNEHVKKSTECNIVNSLHYDISKYGKENFSFTIIDNCSDNETLNSLEIDYITKYDTFNNGYNRTTGGDSMYKHRYDTKYNMSLRSTDSKPVLVYDIDGIFYREFISANRAAVELGIDPRGVFRVLSKKRRKSKGFYFIWKESDEYELSIDTSIKCKCVWDKKIYKYNLNGELCGVYESAKDAATKDGVDIGRITRVLIGKRPNCGGFYYTTDSNFILDIEHRKRKILLLDDKFEIIESYQSVKEASIENKINASSISRVLHGHRKSIYGKKFVFSEIK